MHARAALPPELTVGSTFARHRIEAVAGRGGMGVVFRATDLALEALPEAGVARPVGRDQLEGDGPAEGELGRPVDDPHAAAAGDRLDATAGEFGAWEQVGHGD